ncbi:TPA: hypothetical protein VGT17_005444 [Vibrio harveyi]|uniref:hypothetical protein n=1 Tax=Vibrio parahaemolyticus TaxID=670 RepID=UPI00112141F1|nr:hypothetical protein [Vibrio parahaemolyticus]TOL18529.1 hypothetical protein CGI02_24555 [Vibrio parahaemolyticus]HEQ3590681.1 hypothetical protein [Vibrio harveyi]HEQ3599476.1 hypothetical protein [Vibrio harveyi]HEQ3611520.1 hypothetical protein [Vibrio harveyi]
MSLNFYIKRAEFLEKLIEENPENTGLIQAYVKLVEKVAEIQLQFFKGKESVDNEANRQRSERVRIDADVKKTSIEKLGFSSGEWENSSDWANS